MAFKMEWRVQVDRFVPASSRWHSSHVGLTHTRDALGDALVSALREAGRTGLDDSALSRWIGALVWRLEDYEEESRLLVKLADTGRVVKILEGAVRATLELLNIRDDESVVAYQWLEDERETRVEMYETLMRSSPWELLKDVQSPSEQLEALTLLKHGLYEHGDALTAHEFCLIQEALALVFARSEIVTVEIPGWFIATQGEWYETSISWPSGGETGCLRHVAIWSRLNHPNVRRFYGARHVGVPFIVHELSFPLSKTNRFSWRLLRGCAVGLEYLHDRRLCHERLTVDTLFVSSANDRGLISGLGLVREAEDDNIFRASAANDVLAFGLAVFQLLALARAPNNEPVHTLPQVQPGYLSEVEWQLLRGMCAAEPADRMAITQVVQAMGDLAKDENPEQPYEDTELLETIEDVQAYQFSPANGQTIDELLRRALHFCEQEQEFTDVKRSVFDRLDDLNRQLQAAPQPLPRVLVDEYCLILWRSYQAFEQGSSVNYSTSAASSVSRSIFHDCWGIQHDIDHLILQWSCINSSRQVHRWQLDWNDVKRRYYATAPTGQDYPEEHDVTTAVWFIPPYQVKRGEHIATGAFGSTYHGRWLDTDVVVKQMLHDSSLAEHREQFRRELDLWFSLNHENIVKLYGACSEGQPYFVCELATNGTLPCYLEGKDRFTTWDCLWYAARGLGHLHDRGVVHGDLKGNNILVGDDQTKVKLADFGMGFLASSSTAKSRTGGSAARWAAPECLLGASPTFASDVYSFAMCIIEVVTGEFPWGALDDRVVLHYVTKEKRIPPRPQCFHDDEWELVQRMSCVDPEERISMPAVSRIAYEIGAKWGVKLASKPKTTPC